ncbi:hypothetical protein Arash_gp64c [Salmonella phage Arash]|jgi:hypothetical protein|nr:hypothetical protein Arash_gp64c [Salmonella phage Arash]
MYSYQDFAKAVFDELKPGETFEEWDAHTFYSSEPPMPEMTFCERWFMKGNAPAPYILNNENYILVQLSCTDGQWEIFTADQESNSAVQYQTEAEAREAWTFLLGE